MAARHTRELPAPERIKARKNLWTQQNSATASIGRAKADLHNHQTEAARTLQTLGNQERDITEIRVRLVALEMRQKHPANLRLSDTCGPRCSAAYDLHGPSCMAFSFVRPHGLCGPRCMAA